MPQLSSFISAAGLGGIGNPWPGHGGPNDPPHDPPSPLVIPLFFLFLFVFVVILLILTSPNPSPSWNTNSIPDHETNDTSWTWERQEIQPPKWSDEVGGKTCNSNSLCDACHNAVQQSRLTSRSRFTSTAPAWTGFWRQHPSLKELRASSRELCHLCSLLWQAIPPNRRQSLLEKEEVLEGEIERMLDDPLDRRNSRDLLREKMRIRIKVFEQVSFSGPQTCMQVYHREGPISRQLEIQKVARSESKQTQFTTTTNTKYHFAIAENWIRECRSKHKRCQLQREFDTPFPTRLVYVGEEGNWDILRLHLTSPANHKQQYLALSHCWGTTKILTLTKENTSSMLDSIPFMALAQNFRDAIDITRRLGFSYIWIDSLCIIQDSMLDWIRESAIMDSIYSHAFLTIASTGSDSSSGGCFHSRNPLSLSPCTIATSTTSSLVVAPASSSSAIFDEIEYSPLSQRGWVFQERLLSQRILHFSANLLWECCELTASEFDVVGVKYRYTINEQTYKKQTLQEQRKPSRMCVAFGEADEHTELLREQKVLAQVISTQRLSPGDTLQEPRVHWNDDVRTGHRGAYETLIIPKQLALDGFTQLSRVLGFHIRWFELVKHYTKAHLTQPQDKLVAIAGIARKVQRARGLTYLAGIWKEYLPLNLLWHLDAPAHERPAVYRAPTWSWAAIDGQIMHSLVQIKHSLSLGYQVDAEDAPAQVEEVQVTTHGSPATDPADLLDGGFIKLKGALYTVSDIRYSSGRAYILNGHGEIIALFLPDIVMSKPYPELYSLKIACFKKNFGSYSKTEIQGLVLKRNEDETFARMGFFTNLDASGHHLVFDAFESDPLMTITIV